MASDMEHKLLSSILLLLFDGLIYLKVNVPFAESATSVSSFFESHEGKVTYYLNIKEKLICI